MTREELDKAIDYILRGYCFEKDYHNDMLSDLEDFRNACIRYGFEKGRELDTSPQLHENARMIRPLYKSADEVLAELDEEQDDKR